MALTTCRRHSSRKCSAQKLALWRGQVDDGRLRQVRHFDPTSRCIVSTAGDDRTDLDDVVVGELGVARHQRAVADDQMRLAVQLELVEQRVDPATTADLDLARGVAQQDPHGRTWLGEPAARRVSGLKVSMRRP